MIGAVTGGEGLGSTANIFLTQQQGLNNFTPSSSLTGGEGAGGSNQSTVTISPPGQLLSDLQQLQAQNPAQFTQVVSQIAGQLQAAAQQTQGPQSSLLSSLAAKFQNVAQGGSLSQLQPQQGHHHHHHGGHQAYSQTGQATSGDVTALSPSSTSPDGSSLQQLFATISSEVTSALSS
jgi:hypothetical protein